MGIRDRLKSARGLASRLNPFGSMDPQEETRDIGRIYLNGEIRSYLPMKIPMEGPHVDPETTEQLIYSALEYGVGGLVFDINCPGGSPVATYEVAEMIKSIDIPTVAFVRDVAASGGYWIASACDKIVANELTAVGSVGVISRYKDKSEKKKKQGVKDTIIRSGRFKDMGGSHRAFTEEELEMLQEKSDYVHEVFIREIANNRNIDIKVARAFSEGQTYLVGKNGLDYGLVDFIGFKSGAFGLVEQMGNFSIGTVINFVEQDDKLTPGMLESMLARSYSNGPGEIVHSRILPKVLAQKMRYR